jgi:hypothetical protein
MWPFVVLTLVLSQTAVEPPHFILKWNVPCAHAPDVTGLLGNLRGEASVNITRIETAHWRLEVAFASPSADVRTVEAQSCEEAADAALLLLKLGATEEDETVAAIEPVQVEQPPVAAPAPPLAPFQVRINLGAVADIGALPAATPRLAVSVGLSRGLFEGLLSLRVGIPSNYGPEPTSGARFELHPALGGQASACVLQSVGRFRLGGCAVFLAEWWRWAGYDVQLPSSGSEVWLAAGVDAKLTIDFGDDWFAVASAGTRISVRRAQFAFGTHAPVFEVPIAAAEGELGVGWRW